MKKVKASDIFGISALGGVGELLVPCFSKKTPFVPDVDENYLFDENALLAILVSLSYNKKMMLSGLHGSGKSTHVEQVAARLNWPLLRLNLDYNIGRLELIGKDTIVLKDSKQITEFKEGILPTAVRNSFILLLDEYDAARPETLFVLQRLLEDDGKLMVAEKNELITPHEHFRVFATSNTVGGGDEYGIYSGTQALNQAQLDRWNMVVELDYLNEDKERDMLQSKFPKVSAVDVLSLVQFANLVRRAFKAGQAQAIMSTRGCIFFLQSYTYFGNLQLALKYSFLNRIEVADRALILEFFQRCFG